MMRLAVLLLLLLDCLEPRSLAAGAESPEKTASSAKPNSETAAQKQRQPPLTAQQASVAKQMESVRKQLGPSAGPAGSFFTLPASEAPAFEAAGVQTPQCDRIPDEQVAPIIEQAARREGIKPDLLRAVIQQESGYRPCAVSAKGAQGLMQLMPATVEQFAVKDVFDASENVNAGAKFLKQLLNKYAGDVALALGAYNAGPARVDASGGVPAIPETVNYVNKILNKAKDN
jgi:soluble lytic murein transglycosylase-like protein